MRFFELFPCFKSGKSSVQSEIAAEVIKKDVETQTEPSSETTTIDTQTEHIWKENVPLPKIIFICSVRLIDILKH